MTKGMKGFQGLRTHAFRLQTIRLWNGETEEGGVYAGAGHFELWTGKRRKMRILSKN